MSFEDIVEKEMKKIGFNWMPVRGSGDNAFGFYGHMKTKTLPSKSVEIRVVIDEDDGLADIHIPRKTSDVLEKAFSNDFRLRAHRDVDTTMKGWDRLPDATAAKHIEKMVKHQVMRLSSLIREEEARVSGVTVRWGSLYSKLVKGVEREMRDGLANEWEELAFVSKVLDNRISRDWKKLSEVLPRSAMNDLDDITETLEDADALQLTMKEFKAVFAELENWAKDNRVTIL